MNGFGSSPTVAYLLSRATPTTSNHGRGGAAIGEFAKALADRVLARPEAASERLVDDDDGGGLGAIACVKIPSDNQRNPEGPEMASSDAIAIDERCIDALALALAHHLVRPVR
jgi:hypothetical protein